MNLELLSTVLAFLMAGAAAALLLYSFKTLLEIIVAIENFVRRTPPSGRRRNGTPVTRYLNDSREDLE